MDFPSGRITCGSDMALTFTRCITRTRSKTTFSTVLGNVFLQKSPFHTSDQLGKKQHPNKKSSNVTAHKWVSRQLNDPYVRKARYESYRCRSAYKLLEMDEIHGFLKPGHVVIDCGAAPGSWCEVAVKKVNSRNDNPGEQVGKVIGIDIEHMAPVDGATIICQTDFTDIASQKKILQILEGRKADIVLSDMAPKASGVRSLDHENIVRLCTTALRFSIVTLKEGGTFLGKLLQGPEQKPLEDMIRVVFKDFKIVKPPASRSDSAELFLLGKGFRGMTKPQ